MSFISSLKVTKAYWERKDEEKMGVKSPFPPIMIDLHPTLACNCKCFYCISANHHVTGVERPSFDRKLTLEWDVLKKVIEEINCMGVKTIQLTGGGEPTLYPQFADLLEEIFPHRRVHCYPSPHIGLITNGVIAGEYAKDIIGACDWVRVSLDASNSSMYKQIKSADHFNEVIASLEKLLEARGKNKRPRIGVAYIITPESIEGVGEVSRLMNRVRPDYLQFKDVVNRGLEFSKEYRRSIEGEMRTANEECAIPVMYTSHESVGADLGFSVCDALDYVAVIGADGNVYGCCHREYLPGSSYGSIYEQKFARIWAKKQKLELNQKLCWNCRFGEMNRTVVALKQIQDSDFL
jgi:wyosine [tRNA(Phe)-imidazoG37] synthetase (radical SAM superfamily)